MLQKHNRRSITIHENVTCYKLGKQVVNIALHWLSEASHHRLSIVHWSSIYRPITKMKTIASWMRGKSEYGYMNNLYAYA